MFEMYNVANLARALRDPSLVGRNIRHQPSVPNNWPFYRRYKAGLNDAAEDWGNLFLPDADRFDKFAARNRFDGRLEHRIAPPNADAVVDERKDALRSANRL